MKEYCCGFLFNSTLDSVVLIEKKRPDFMVGLLNGIGGLIEKGESAIGAMYRETKEEIGVSPIWYPFITLDVPEKDTTIHFFRARSTDAFRDARMQEDEILQRHCVSALKSIPVVSDLRWLIPMAITRTVLRGRVTCTWTPNDWWENT